MLILSVFFQTLEFADVHPLSTDSAILKFPIVLEVIYQKKSKNLTPKQKKVNYFYVV